MQYKEPITEAYVSNSRGHVEYVVIDELKDTFPIAYSKGHILQLDSTAEGFVWANGQGQKVQLKLTFGKHGPNWRYYGYCRPGETMDLLGKPAILNEDGGYILFASMEELQAELERRNAATPSPLLCLLIGPSGVGKSTIQQTLVNDGYRKVKSCTTRQPRYKGEDTYHFLTLDEFHAASIYTKKEYAGNWYGVSGEELSKGGIFVIEPEGAKELLSGWSGRKPVVIGLTASPATLLSRMRGRNSTEEELQARVKEDKSRFANMEEYCDAVFRSEGTLDQILAIIRAYLAVVN